MAMGLNFYSKQTKDIIFLHSASAKQNKFTLLIDKTVYNDKLF